MEPTTICHVVALPYPGRGHVNPMMNLCNQLASRKPDIRVTFVVTEEWHGLLAPEPRPDNVVLAAVPNVVPSERDRSKDLAGFVEAVWTKLEAPVEELLDRLEQPVSCVVADCILVWAVGLANRRNIPMASLWTMSASMFSMIYHFDLLRQNAHFPVELSERGHEVVDYIPGISSTRLADFPGGIFRKSRDNEETLPRALRVAREVSKAQYLLCTSVYELEPLVFDALTREFPFPIYPIGPGIGHFLLESPYGTASHTDINANVPKYLQWLNSQPKDSVLYVSFGSFLSVSSAQLEEIAAGIRSSGTRYIWVVREDVSKINDILGCCENDDNVGFVVPWCDQLRVLCHSSVGGFWTHGGWNSTMEALLAGVPMLTFPIIWDQVPNSKQIVEDWKIGYKVKEGLECGESFVTRDEIADLVKRFMDPKNDDRKAMSKRVKELQKECHRAISKGGSSHTNLDAFINDISRNH